MHLFSLWVFFEKPYLKKSVEKPTEFHGAMRRIVICCRTHTGEYLFFVQTRLVYWIQRRAYFHTGKFAILEFIPASSPSLCSYRQDSPRLCSYRQDSPSLCSYRQDSPSFEFISARFAKFEFISARYAKFWVLISKICQIPLFCCGQKVYTASVPIPVYSEWIRPECQRVFDRGGRSAYEFR